MKILDKIKEIGHWELTITNEIDVMAYYLYCKDIYIRKHNVLTYINPPVLDQKYFNNSGLGKQYKKKAIQILRGGKINNFLNKKYNNGK